LKLIDRQDVSSFNIHRPGKKPSLAWKTGSVGGIVLSQGMEQGEANHE
jgi:hypothetical protein